MSGFAERMDQRRQTPEDRLRKMVDGAAQVSAITEADQLAESAKSARLFREAGLHDFLQEAVLFARERDEYRDVSLEFSMDRFGYDSTPAWLSPKETKFVNGILRIMFDNDRVFDIAVAEMRWNNKAGKATKGYSFLRVYYLADAQIVGIEGETTNARPLKKVEQIKDFISDAYDNPGVVQPLDYAPDDLAEEKPIEFLNKSGDFS